MMVVLFEIPLLNKEYGEIMLNADSNFNYIFIWISGFSFFAFLTTLIREIIKDAEDFEGDSAYGMSTLPIVIGGFFTKLVLAALILFLIFCLVWVPLKYIVFSSDDFDYISSVYFVVLLVVPSLFLLLRVFYARTKYDYSFASQLTKFIMMSGILYSIVVRYIVLYQIN
jgi:4-hydroxybenzoate polyprenyltransferase